MTEEEIKTELNGHIEILKLILKLYIKLGVIKEFEIKYNTPEEYGAKLK